MAERRYGEREAAEILRRAVGKQGERFEGTVGGLSLEDLQRIGAEVGIDPADVTLAASEVEQGLDQRGMRHVRAVQHERILFGEMDADAFDACVNELRRVFGSPGEIHREGDRWTWSQTSAASTTRFEVVVRGGKTRLFLHSDLSDGVLATLILGGLVGFFSSVAGAKLLWASGSIWAVLGLLAAGSIVMGLAYGITSLGASRARKRNTELMETLERLAQPAIRENLASAPAPVVEEEHVERLTE